MSYNFSHFYLDLENYSFWMRNLYFLKNTTFGDLLKAISFFYFDGKICKCFNFQISKDGNKGNYFQANVTLLNFYNTYSTHFLYVQIKNNKEKKCKCNEKNHQSINNYLEKDILNSKKRN